MYKFDSNNLCLNSILPEEVAPLPTSGEMCASRRRILRPGQNDGGAVPDASIPIPADVQSRRRDPWLIATILSWDQKRRNSDDWW